MNKEEVEKYINKHCKIIYESLFMKKLKFSSGYIDFVNDNFVYYHDKKAHKLYLPIKHIRSIEVVSIWK